MKALTYAIHGIKGESKCNVCKTWTPIKELKKWDGMCYICYTKKWDSANNGGDRT